MPGAEKRRAKNTAEARATRGAANEMHEGTLAKRCEGNLLRKWQPRYCVLSDRGLTYFKSKRDRETAGDTGTFLPNARLLQCSVAGLDIVLQTRERMLVFRAARQDECEQWAMHLQTAIIGSRAADFASCGIGDSDTKHWAENVKPVSVGGRGAPDGKVCAMCKVYKDSAEWQEVLEVFSQTLPREALVRCMRIQHKQLLHSYRMFRSDLERRVADDVAASRSVGSGGVHVRRVFHGASTPRNTMGIVDDGFRQPHAGKGSGVFQYGRGCYFARDAALAARYSSQVDMPLAHLVADNPDRLVGTHCIFLANMIVGDMAVGRHDSPQAPKIPDSACQRRFDTLTDKEDDPMILVSTDDAQCYPAYLLFFSKDGLGCEKKEKALKEGRHGPH